MSGINSFSNLTSFTNVNNNYTNFGSSSDFSIFSPLGFNPIFNSTNQDNNVFQPDIRRDRINYGGGPAQIFSEIRSLAIVAMDNRKNIQAKAKSILGIYKNDHTAAIFALAFIRANNPSEYALIINKMKESAPLWERDDINWLIAESEKYELRGEQFFSIRDNKLVDVIEIRCRYNTDWFSVMNMNVLAYNQTLVDWDNKYLQALKQPFAAGAEKKTDRKSTNNTLNIFSIYDKKRSVSNSETLENVFQTFNNTIRKVFSEEVTRQRQIFLEMRAQMAKELLQSLKNEQRKLEQMRMARQIDTELLDKSVKMLQSTIEYISARRREVYSNPA